MSPPPSAQLGDATACSAALRDAQNRIVRYEKELPPTTRFEIADAHDDAQELRARPEIDRLLGKRAHTLECRGAICKVEIVDKSGANGDWAEALQTDPRLRRLVDGFQFHAGTPAQDPVTGEALMRNDVYLVMNDPDAALGVDVVTSVWNDLARSGFVRTCVDRNPAAKGALELAIALDPDAHRIAVTPGGTLPNTAVGSCLLGEVERAFAAVSVPAKVTSAHWYHSIALPDDAR